MLTTLGATRTLTVLKGDATSQDGYGADVASWTEVEVPGCSWWPSATSEQHGGGSETATSRYGVLFPEGTAVTKLDRVRLPDVDGMWSIDGDPRQHVSPITGTVGGLYAWLEKVTG